MTPAAPRPPRRRWLCRAFLSPDRGRGRGRGRQIKSTTAEKNNKRGGSGPNTLSDHNNNNRKKKQERRIGTKKSTLAASATRLATDDPPPWLANQFLGKSENQNQIETGTKYYYCCTTPGMGLITSCISPSRTKASAAISITLAAVVLFHKSSCSYRKTFTFFIENIFAKLMLTLFLYHAWYMYI